MNSRNSPKIVRQALCLLATLACSSPATPSGPQLPLISDVRLLDVANRQDPSDLVVQFSVSGEVSEVGEFRVFVVSASDPRLTEATAASLGGSSYASSSATTGRVQVSLPTSMLDASGSAVAVGQDYQAYVLTLAAGENALSGPSAPTSLQVTDLVESFGTPFSASGGVAVGPAGNVYVADFGPALSSPVGSNIYVLSPGGTRNIFASGFSGASGNAFGADGTLYQSNIASGVVNAITPAGVSSIYSTGHAGPVGVVAMPDGTLLVSNCTGDEVRRVQPDGSASVFVSGPPLSCPNGIAADTLGNVYAVNFNDGSVIRVTPDGAMTVLAITTGGGNGHVTFANNRLYVVDRVGHRIWEVLLDGTASVIAGSGARGKTDGAALTSEFSLPNGISASASGDTLYVNDLKAVTGPGLHPVIMRRIILAAARGG